jgi:hypothetical protein
MITAAVTQGRVDNWEDTVWLSERISEVLKKHSLSQPQMNMVAKSAALLDLPTNPIEAGLNFVTVNNIDEYNEDRGWIMAFLLAHASDPDRPVSIPRIRG